MATYPSTVPRITTTTAATPTENCRNCNPNTIEVLMGPFPSKIIEIDEIGMNANGCVTRTFQCDGLEDPVQTEFQWNRGAGGHSRDTPESVRRTLTCDNRGRWILMQDGLMTPIMEVQCFATSLNDGEDAGRR
ncbi:hypothetical protein QR680_013905 [Steinernema hermaphroditum]|uniref:Uncharacterized protein n=1 Tax=Steinernema hermaphroditum TaxID=289476 RepID=A0AA39M3B1_9BILA|nr:hypothetical protein QR680_013905 [Steinernema hermaphroditum]